MSPTHEGDPATIGAFLSVSKLWTKRWFNPRVEGIENIPQEGPCLLVANHNSIGVMPEVHVLGQAMHNAFGTDRLPRTLVHANSFRTPALGKFFVALGAVPAEPGVAMDLLARGERVLVFPGGEKDSMRSFKDRHRIIFEDRRGYLRLALRANVPVVPVVTAFAHETAFVLSDGATLAKRLGITKLTGFKRWPIVLSLPWGITFGPPPMHIPLPSRIDQVVMPPVRFERHGEEAANDRAYIEECHARVHGAMQATLDGLVAERRARRRARIRG